MMDIFLFFLFVSFIINIVFLILFKKYKFLIDKPLEQSHNLHKTTALKCGGVTIYLVFLSGFFVLKSQYKYTFLISTLSFLTGFIEDLYKGISPKIRFLVLFIISVILIHLKPEVLLSNIGIFKFPYYLAIIITIIAVVGFTNSINITDGLNGLASGIVLNALFFIGSLIYLNKDFEMLKFIAILSGATAGFFIVNFFTGRVFLGDGGAYFLGMVLAIISLYISNTYTNISPWFFLVLFGYPVTDTVFSMYRRYIKNKKIFHSDILHMHILLNKRIFKNQIKASFLIIITSFIFSVIAWNFKSNTVWLVFIYLIYVFIYIFSYFRIIK
jgi:UDP-N-acetylmuramyl pentapeptide phosphotransferase/UDP-N-acetylglucosamine-1-phosphate transferase